MDITHCTGEGCKVKTHCHRFKEGVREYKGNYSSYFLKPPHTLKNNVFECDMFWGNRSEATWTQIKTILDAGSFKDK